MSADLSSSYPDLTRRRAFLIPFTVACGNFMGGLDGFIVTTALPQMAHSLGEPPLRVSLAITSYLLSMAVFTPISGWAADRFGIRRVYAAAILIFTLASVLCGLSGSLWLLVAARAIQGFGGALGAPIGQLVVLRTFPKERMLKVNNYIIMASLLGPLSGPLVGGFLTTYMSWPWMLYVNVPIGVINIALAWRLFPDRPAERRTVFDFRGFVMVGAALALLQIGVGMVGATGREIPTIGLFASVAALIGYYIVHAFRSANPLLDLRLFQIRTFSISSLAGGLSSIGINAMVFLMPLLFQLGFGMSAMQSGTRTFIMALSSILARGLAIPVLRRFGFRSVLVWNTILLALLIAAAMLLQADTPIWLTLAYLFLFGLPRAIQFAGMQNLAYADMPADRMSRFATLTGVFNQMWQTLAVGAAAGLLAVLAGPGGRNTPDQFRVTFIVAALIVLASLIGFLRIRQDDGIRVTGHGVAPAVSPPAISPPARIPARTSA